MGYVSVYMSLLQWRKVSPNYTSNVYILTYRVVEAYKSHWPYDKELHSGVDWLTEVIRRFSDAAMASRPFSTVNMKSPFRSEKVRSLISPLYELCVDSRISGRNKSPDTLTGNGPGMKSRLSRMLFIHMALSFAPLEMKS
jgi:hypothetical protein